MYYRTTINPHGGAEGEGVLDFSANTNPLGMPPEALAAARAALDRADRYPDPFCRELTAAVAAWAGVPESRVLCGSGASELIYAWCAAVRPRRAALLAPTFSEYETALALHGCAVQRYALRAENGFVPESDLLDFLRRERPEALVLCNPNNPTGRLFPPALLGETADLCRRLDIRLLADECFLDLSRGDRSLRDRLAEHPGLAVLNACTKTWGMAGLRLGWCLSADGALLARMGALSPPWNVSAVAQAAGTAALSAGGPFLARTRALLEAERPFLRGALEGLGLWVCPSEANFILFRGPESLGGALRANGAAVRDCANFPGLGPGWYRTAVRTHEENLGLLAALDAALKTGHS